MATRTSTGTAIHIRVFTAFSDAPQTCLIRGCCLIPLKKSSTCHLFLYKAAMFKAGRAFVALRTAPMPYRLPKLADGAA